jgi:hypothetical protein
LTLLALSKSLKPLRLHQTEQLLHDVQMCSQGWSLLFQSDGSRFKIILICRAQLGNIGGAKVSERSLD